MVSIINLAPPIFLIIFSVSIISPQKTAVPTLLLDYINKKQFLTVSKLFKDGRRQQAVIILRRMIGKFPKNIRLMFRKEFSKWIAKNAKMGVSRNIDDGKSSIRKNYSKLDFLNEKQRESINMKLLNCNRLGAMLELLEYIEKLLPNKKLQTIQNFKGKLANLSFFTRDQWNNIVRREEIGDQVGSNLLVRRFLKELPDEQREMAEIELEKAREIGDNDMCALSQAKRHLVLDRLARGDRRAANELLDRFVSEKRQGDVKKIRGVGIN